MVEINVQKLVDVELPTRGSREAAGRDVKSLEDAVIKPGEVHVFRTGLAMEIPQGYFGGIYSRSGMSTKRGLTVSTGTSILDSDYRGEIFVGLRNLSKEDQKIYKGDKIAQIVIQPYVDVQYRVVDKLCETERGEGGFGSTGR